MKTVTISLPLAAELWKVNGEEVELRDDHGNLIGRFAPPSRAIPPDFDLTEEEVADLLRPDRKTYTTAEVLAHAKGMAK